MFYVSFFFFFNLLCFGGILGKWTTVKQQPIQQAETLAVYLQGFFPRKTGEEMSLLSGQLQVKSFPCTGICVDDSTGCNPYFILGQSSSQSSQITEEKN